MEEMNYLSTDKLWFGILLMLMLMDNETREEVVNRFGCFDTESSVPDNGSC